LLIEECQLQNIKQQDEGSANIFLSFWFDGTTAIGHEKFGREMGRKYTYTLLTKYPVSMVTNMLVVQNFEIIPDQSNARRNYK
jgi:hypothetical protein